MRISLFIADGYPTLRLSFDADETEQLGLTDNDKAKSRNFKVDHDADGVVYLRRTKMPVMTANGYWSKASKGVGTTMLSYDRSHHDRKGMKRPATFCTIRAARLGVLGSYHEPVMVPCTIRDDGVAFSLPPDILDSRIATNRHVLEEVRKDAVKRTMGNKKAALPQIIAPGKHPSPSNLSQLETMINAINGFIGEQPEVRLTITDRGLLAAEVITVRVLGGIRPRAAKAAKASEA